MPFRTLIATSFGYVAASTFARLFLVTGQTVSAQQQQPSQGSR